ncbi:MAG: ribosome silencing factor [Gammaproteobacteria bacterium]
MNTKTLTKLIHKTLDDHKAQNITLLDVTELTQITDCMIICSGTSTRHVKALSDHVVKVAKENHIHVLGIEGEREAEWILVDLDNVIVHIMIPTTREFYQLEKLCDIKPSSQVA